MSETGAKHRSRGATSTGLRRAGDRSFSRAGGFAWALLLHAGTDERLAGARSAPPPIRFTAS